MVGGEFVEVLKMAMEYYRPYTQNEEDSHFMCLAIGNLKISGRITRGQRIHAVALIDNIIAPHATLRMYLEYEKGIECSNKDLMRFWEDIIDGRRG